MAEINDELIVPFGKYKGQKIGNVPASYLIYIWENQMVWGDVKTYINDNIDVLRKELEKEKQLRYINKKNNER